MMGLFSPKKKEIIDKNYISLLEEAGRKFSTNLSFDEILRLLLYYGEQISQAEGVVIEVYNPKRKSLNIRYSSGISSEREILGNISYELIKEPRNYRIIEIKATPWVPYWLKEEGFEIYLGFPLKVQQEIFGIISFLYKGKLKLTPSELTLFSSFIGQVALTLQASHLYNTTKEALRKKTTSVLALHHIDESLLTYAVSLQDELEIIVKEANAALESETTAVFIYSSLTDELELKATYPSHPPLKLNKLEISREPYRRIIISKSPLLLKDTQAKELNFIEGKELRNILLQPLFFKEELIGLLIFFNKKEPDAEFSPSDLTVAKAISAQASLIIKITHLYEDLKSSSAALATVYEITRSLVDGFMLDSTLKLILRRATEAFRAKDGSILLLDEHSGYLTIKAAFGLPEEIIRTVKKKPGDGSIVGWVAENKEPLLLIGRVADPRFRSAKLKDGVKDAMCVPIMMEHKLIGVLNISNSQIEGLFTDNDLALLCSLANEAALAIHRSQMHQNSLRQLAELNAVKEIASLSYLGKDIKEILSVALYLGVNTIECELGIIYLYSEVEEGYKVELIRGQRRIDETLFKDVVIKEEGHIAKVVAEKKGFSFEVEKEPQFMKLEELDMPIKTVLTLPIIIEDKVEGVIEFLNKLTFPVFKEEDLRAGELLVACIAVALKNYRSYEEIRVRAMHQSTAHSLHQILGLPQDKVDLASQLVNFIKRTLRCLKCAIYLFSEYDENLLSIISHSGFEKEEEEKLHYVTLGGGLAGKSVLSKQLVELNKRKNIIPISEDELSLYPEDNYLASPIKRGEKGIGAILVAAKLSPYNKKKELFSPWDKELLATISEQVALAFENAMSYTKERENLYSCLKNILKVSLPSLKEKEDISFYALLLAKAIKLPPQQQDIIKTAALFADIGKIGLPYSLLEKERIKEPLSPQEEEEYRKHVTYSQKILQPLENILPISNIAYYHHENYDGTGYPEGIRGESIPLGARIIKIAEEFVRLTKEENYSASEAIQIMEKKKGYELDAKLVESFAKAWEEFTKSEGA